MFRHSIFIAVLFPLIAHHAQAKSAGLTIEELTAVAVERSSAIKAMRAEIEAAHALRGQAAIRPSPELSASAGFKDAPEDTGFEVEAEVLFPWERGGKRPARVALSESELALAEAEMAQVQRDLQLQVHSLAYAFLVASTDASVASETAERSRTLIEMLKERPVAGPALLLELRVIEASLAEFQNTAIEFEAQRKTAQSALNILLGQDPDEPLHLVGKLTAPDDRFDRDQLLRAIDALPAVRKRLAQLNKAAAEITARRGESKRDIQIGPYVSYEEAGESETVVGLAMELPLGGNRNASEVAAAESRQTGAEAQLEAERSAMAAEIIERLTHYEAALKHLDAVPARLVEDMHAAADLADRQYRLGAIPVQLFLEVQRELLAVQQLRHTALLEARQLAAELDWLRAVTAGDKP